MIIKSDADLKALKTIGRIVAIVREEMLKGVRPGITTRELDKIGSKVLTSYNARSAPIKDYKFPGFTCISINEELAHGIPGRRVIKSGDIVNIDVSAELDGYYADTGASIVVGRASSEVIAVCKCAERALYKAISEAKAGALIRELGKAVESEARASGLQVVRNLSGHGIGKKLHEKPEYILNYADIWNTDTLREGQVIAIETFITSNASYVVKADDDWTLKTADGSIGAQFEHTVVVTDGEPIILTKI